MFSINHTKRHRSVPMLFGFFFVVVVVVVVVVFFFLSNIRMFVINSIEQHNSVPKAKEAWTIVIAM